ncbi:unnamed protein product [Boreogadus saida]
MCQRRVSRPFFHNALFYHREQKKSPGIHQTPLQALFSLPSRTRPALAVCITVNNVWSHTRKNKSLRARGPNTSSRDLKMRATINQKLTEMGERERLKELLRAKLTECGWKDQMKAHCKEVIKEKGLEHVTVEDLVVEITPKGRALVPDSVKKELLQRIRMFLAQHAT